MRLVGLGQKLRQILVGRRVVELALEMIEALGEPITSPSAVSHRRLATAETQVAAEGLVIHVPPGHADHGELLRQQTLRVEDCEGPGQAGAW